MSISAFTIAEWFIAHNNAVMRFNSADEISNLKIQKLLYYAQGCSLASTGDCLFYEDIVAWKHGPVVEKVYEKYQKYGRSGITDIPQYPQLDIKIEKLLLNTYNAFAKYSAWELANLTHKEDPWRCTPSLHTISNELIRDYFLNHYKSINENNELTGNVDLLREFACYESNWDGEGGLAFGADFIQEVIDLVSTLQQQPDVGATGRGSIDLEYGTVRSGHNYLDIEIYEFNRRVRMLHKDKDGNTFENDIEMEDINGYIQQF
ncbi:Uncharacterized phage-associated protein [Lachnospiraceae bacterium NE2001]|nr:Uncharacterized phage-associated protein [Lachnospiraceae bacterium NE2001]